MTPSQLIGKESADHKFNQERILFPHKKVLIKLLTCWSPKQVTGLLTGLT